MARLYLMPGLFNLLLVDLRLDLRLDLRFESWNNAFSMPNLPIEFIDGETVYLRLSM